MHRRLPGLSVFTFVAFLAACSVQEPKFSPARALRASVPPCNNTIAIVPCTPTTQGPYTFPPDTVFLTFCNSDFIDPFHDSSLEYRMRMRNSDMSTFDPASVYGVYCGANGFSDYFPPAKDTVPIYYLARPHENTREAFELELYDKSNIGSVSRIFSAVWYWDYNSFNQYWSKDETVCTDAQCPLFSTSCNRCNNVTSGTAVRIRWTPVSYPTATVTLDSSSLDVAAGTSVVLTARAFAPNGVEIYNQTTTRWQSTDSTVAYGNPSGGYAVPSTFGMRWRNVSDTIVARAAGVATISTSINGKGVSLPVTVRPTATISGPTYVGTIGYTTWTANPSGCNSSCTYQWSIRWYDPTLAQYRENLLGTGQSQTVYVTSGYYGSFTMIAVPISNGVTGIKATLGVSNGTYHTGPTTGGCGTKLIC